MSFSDRVLGFGAFPNRDTTYDIDQSLMFASGDGAYLHRTPGSAGNRKTWTFSAWVKRGHIGAYQYILDCYGAGNNAGYFGIYFSNDDTLYIQGWSNTWIRTAAKYRDPSAWYHIVFALDTTQSTAADRFTLYVNGSEISEWTSDDRSSSSEDDEYAVNNSVIQKLGVYYDTTSYEFDGYMAEVHLIDGTALTPSAFGKTDSDTGQWIPKEAAGLTYGTNGFYLKFVSGAIGTDSAGSNNYTTVNLADADVMLDTPTNNFAVLNPIEVEGATLTQGNLHKNSNDHASATFFLSSGKWYCEVALLSGSSSSSTFNYYIAVEDSLVGVERHHWASNYVSLGMANGGNTPDGFGVFTDTNGTKTDVTGSRPNAVAVIGVAIDVDDGDVEYYINGTLNGKVLGITDWTLPLTVNLAYWTGTMGSQPYSINFGQNGTFNGNVTAGDNADGNGIGNFKYSPPTGYLAMCSKNLPTPTIVKPTDHFSTVLWAGTGSTDQDISGVGFQPDFTWVKKRNDSDAVHVLHDAVRGAGYSFAGTHTSSIDEADDSAHFGPFQSDGFRLADTTSTTNYNENLDTYGAWNWLAGNTTLGTGDFTQGATASTCSRNVDAGFSIVTFTGTGSATTVGHGLSAAPSFMIFRIREAHNIAVYHHKFAASPETVFHYLGSASVNQDDATVWNDTAPTSSVFSVGTSDMVNKSTVNTMAYCWTEVEGYSKFGTYEGNNNADGPFVYTGFRPAYVLVKHIDTSGESYWILDNKRDTHNPTGVVSWANLVALEYDYGEMVDFTSNGFKIKSTNSGMNGYTSTYVFVAFAEFPFKYSNAR